MVWQVLDNGLVREVVRLMLYGRDHRYVLVLSRP